MITKNEYFVDPGRRIPDAGGLPGIGQSLQVVRDPLRLLKRLSRQYGDVVKVRFGLKDFYVIQTPAAARHVLQGNARNYYKPGAAKLMKKVLGDGLATSNGDLWLRQRRLIQPAFHREVLGHFFDILQREITWLVKEWKDSSDLRQPIDISSSFLKLTLKNLNGALFGSKANGNVDEISDVLRTMLDYSSDYSKTLIKFPLFVPTRKNLQFRKAEKKFETLIYGFIEQRQRQQKSDPAIQHNDLLQLLLTAYDDASHTTMTAKQLRDEITTLFMAGHETTSQTLSWIFYRMALQSDIYRSIKNEVNAIEGGNITLDTLRQLPYTRALVEEAMRFYPPVWLIARKAQRADLISGYYLPAGSTVIINVYGMHHSPSYWVDPETFDPVHFRNDMKDALPPFVYLPFGGGQRLCIGQHFAMMVMQTVVARLVQEFSFTVPDKFVPIVDPNVTLRSKENIKLIIQQINGYDDNKCKSRIC